MSKHKTTRRSRLCCCQSMARRLDPRFFKALCDPTRVAILNRLVRRDAACTVSQVSECCPVNISVVSRHLATLRDAGIVSAKKCGKEVFYAVRFPELSGTLRAMADAIDACCPAGASPIENKRGSS